jgi:hypothetical protein
VFVFIVIIVFTIRRAMIDDEKWIRRRGRRSSGFGFRYNAFLGIEVLLLLLQFRPIR